jgi:hypothetical protein
MYLTILSRVLSAGTDIGIRIMLGRFLEASSAGRLRMVALHMLRSSGVKSSRPAAVIGWVTAVGIGWVTTLLKRLGLRSFICCTGAGLNRPGPR